ncbi:MAG: CDP-alcohol phosphatidyltransferase family protein [Pseudomonadota bacterium]
MFFSNLDRQIAGGKNRTPLQTMICQSVAVAIVLGASSLLVFYSATLSLLAFGLATGVIGHALIRSYPHSAFGLANAATLTRTGMVAFLFGAIFHATTSAWLVFSIAVIAFTLDGVDGWIARREGLTSDFGARFDMEVDAALAAVLAIWLMVSGTTGVEILILGFARYLFVAAGLIRPWLAGLLPYSFRRKVICVVQIAALIALLCPATPAAALPWISISAALLLIWSFVVDIRWLARHPA